MKTINTSDTSFEATLLAFVRISQPGLMAIVALTYSLGAAVAWYLGYRYPLGLLLQGLGLILTVQVMGRLLLARDELSSAPDDPRPSIFPSTTVHSQAAGVSTETLLYTAMAVLALGGIQAGALLIQGSPPPAWILLVLITLIAFFFPQLRRAGLGEVLLSIASSLTLAFAFTLLSGAFHQLVLLTSIPVAALAFAAQIVLALPCYAYDLKHHRDNVLTRAGWETGMWFHDLALLIAAASLAIAPLVGLPGRIAAGTLIAAPLAVVQYLHMRRIQSGSPPKWRMTAYLALSLYILTVYLLLMGYIL